MPAPVARDCPQDRLAWPTDQDLLAGGKRLKGGLSCDRTPLRLRVEAGQDGAAEAGLDLGGGQPEQGRAGPDRHPAQGNLAVTEPQGLEYGVAAGGGDEGGGGQGRNAVSAADVPALL